MVSFMEVLYRGGAPSNNPVQRPRYAGPLALRQGRARRDTIDIQGFFMIQHGRLHSGEVGGGESYGDRVFGGLTDEQMRKRPGRGLNSLIWLLWHMARTEDVAVNLVVSNGGQVLDDDWVRRMNVPWRTIGTGMADGEVAELTQRADVAAVRAYRTAVGQRTRDVVRGLPPEAWDDVLGFTDTVRAAAAGAFAPNTPWVDEVGYKPWQGHSRAAQLAVSAIGHNAMHLGEAVTIRSLAGFALGI
jgi:hypothetical protein